MAKYRIHVGQNVYTIYGAEAAWEAWEKITTTLDFIDPEAVAWLEDCEQDEAIAEYGREL